MALAVGTALSIPGCLKRTEQTFAPGSVSVEDSHALMAETLAEIAARSATENIFVGDGLAKAKRAELSQLSPAAPMLRRWLKTYQLAKAELHLGNETESIRLMTDALELIREKPEAVKPEILQQFYFDMAVAFLRWGETQNCCQQNTPNSCIFPIEGDAIHRDREGAERCIEWLTALLRSIDSEEPMHLAARWLLNLAHMTLGNYPSAVPDEYVIEGLGTQEESDPPVRRWPNVARQAGVATFSLAGGAIAEDFDSDGDVDLVVSSWDPKESLRVFWNDGSGKFADGTSQSNLTQILGGLNMTQTDYNNDGLADIFVLRGGWLTGAGQHPNSLLRNNGDHTFTDVTITAGLAQANLPTQTAAWADFDLDGDLDLYVGNESTDEFAAPSQLFRNEGNGTFTDVAKTAGVTNDRLAKAVAWGDYDGDRFPDIYVSNYRGANRLYRNLRDGTFQDVASTLGVNGPEASFPTWFWDVNNDGHLDLFVAAYAGGIAELAAARLNLPFDRDATLPRLYVNDGGGRFTNQAEQFGLTHPTHPMGANFADLDNDGFVDFYLGTGWPEYHELMPNVLYRNRAGRSFEDISAAARVGHLQKGHAVAIADFDNDGDLDLFEQMGGFVPGDKYYDVLYQNPSEHGNWIRVKVTGKRSNRPGIGAQIRVNVFEDGTARSIVRTVSSGGSFGANPFEQHIGIGTATEIQSLEVFWPATGKTDVHKPPPINSRITLVEGEG